MKSQMVLRIDDNKKARFQRIARMEGKTASEKLREMVDNYIAKADISQAVDDIWERVGKKIGKKGFKESDVAGIISEVRKSK